MSNPHNPIVVHPDAETLGSAVAADIADRMSEKIAAGGRFLLGCPGGRSPQTTYAALADEAANRGLDLGSLVIVMMDDYLQEVDGGWDHIPADAHNSCRRFAREDIQAVLNRAVPEEHRVPDANVWFPNPADPSAYDGRIRDAGGIDFFIIASGAGDGHVAFNPPESPVDSRSRIVELAEQTRRDNLATFPDFPSIDAVPTHGVTVGIATIAELSKAGALVLVGADKQSAFGKLADGEGYDPSWPATVYRLIDGAVLHSDAAAAGDRA
ncbi:6-phosphogluconolactonase [Leucobacter sp. gxy201]|uniref:6-phosphogluconolactonase n=1 Tax=Leucobacter sp. gxy201 TaxID=2957200 RepID=UPI003D9FB369